MIFRNPSEILRQSSIEFSSLSSESRRVIFSREASMERGAKVLREAAEMALSSLSEDDVIVGIVVGVVPQDQLAASGLQESENEILWWVWGLYFDGWFGQRVWEGNRSQYGADLSDLLNNVREHVAEQCSEE